MTDIERSDVTSLTVELLSAYLSNNTVSPAELVDLIRSTRTVLSEPEASPEVEPEPAVHTPAVTPRKSVANPEYIISLIDGKAYKALKRHLAGHGLTPQTYRERYNLPSSYPMVAPAFAERRREIAAAIGLGRRPKADANEAQATGAQAPAAKSPAVAKPKAKTANAAKNAPAAEKTAVSHETSVTQDSAKPAPSHAAADETPPQQGKPTKAKAKASAQPANEQPQVVAAEAAPKRRPGRPKSVKTAPEQPQGGTEGVVASSDAAGAKPARRMARSKTKA
ncbi:MucR family transcriptional regulator [Novosphingobium sp. Rr 2-17]|uniref:MucR family transcriptional regulator n=1 Tax=Novosphingobium sp. Rr 2-17 TaxID=555793 RepID=UPI000A307A9C|nr:MucR family transcriptional regulator [Novosphingobium sp. Rr 2-17]